MPIDGRRFEKKNWIIIRQKLLIQSLAMSFGDNQRFHNSH